MFRNITKKEVENIQINHAVVFINHGETDALELGCTRGGAEFVVTETIRQIERDGARGKEKGLEVIDEVNASLKVSLLQLSHDYLKMALASATEETTGTEPNVKKVLKASASGLVPDTHYVKNVTAFARKLNGKACKIVVHNASNNQGLTLTTEDKGEGVIELLMEGHWDPTDYAGQPIYEIEDDVELE